MNQSLVVNLIKSTLITIGVVVISFAAAYGISRIDSLLGLADHRSFLTSIVGAAFLLVGAVFRFWATMTFYRRGIAVLELRAQAHFTAEGPYRFTRNPLYIGITAVFLGSVLILGSLVGIAAAMLLFVGWHVYVVKFEEKDMENKFSSDYKKYQADVPRWL